MDSGVGSSEPFHEDIIDSGNVRRSSRPMDDHEALLSSSRPTFVQIGGLHFHLLNVDIQAAMTVEDEDSWAVLNWTVLFRFFVRRIIAPMRRTIVFCSWFILRHGTGFQSSVCFVIVWQ